MERRSLKMHPDLLMQVIKGQAGTASKAILEAVMNSIDAGSTRVDLRVDARGFSVVDDGKGFIDRNEIEPFFETFGTPHKEGDATYGHYRMGRGQIFSFGINRWRSGEFLMQLDLKKDGLDYLLKDGLPHHRGCSIEVGWYDKLLPSETDSIVRETSEMVAWSQIPVTINGKVVSKLPSSATWDHVTDDAYIKLNGSGSLKVYNLGVLVRAYPSYDFGRGGIVVSRNRLKVNFARNDILVSECTAWKAICKHIKAVTRDSLGESKVRVTEDGRQRIVRMGRAAEMPWNEFLEQKVVTDILGRHHPLIELWSKQLPVTVRPRDSDIRIAEALHARKHTWVLDDRTLDRFEVDSIDELREMLLATIERNIDLGIIASPRHADHHVRAIRQFAAVDFDESSSVLQSRHLQLDDREIDPMARIKLSAIRYINERFVAGAMGVPARRIVPGHSDTADAWTDGSNYIALRLDFIKALSDGYRGAHAVVALLVHEYLHERSNLETNIHDEEFYRRYHDASHETWFPRAVDSLLASYVGVARVRGKAAGVAASRASDAAVKFSGQEVFDEVSAIVEVGEARAAIAAAESSTQDSAPGRRKPVANGT